MPTRLQRLHEAVARADEKATDARTAFRAEVKAEKDGGRTLTDIGEELGLTRQRVAQIINQGDQ
jgi:DNA-directed RNA polymerase sigma subunit (sigma70/sigma32)